MIPRALQITLVLLLVAVFGMGFYALHLRHIAEVTQQRAADLRPVAPPVAGPPQTVTLFVADDRDGFLHPRQATIALPREPSQRAREVLRALVTQYLDSRSPHPLAEGADIRDVFLMDGNTAFIDTTAALASRHRSGIAVENLTLASLAQTLAANLPGIVRVRLLVEGKERETLAGHADLMQFYPVSSAARLVRK